MQVSGILVVPEPSRLEDCARQLEATPGVEVHFRYPELGRLIAVLETETVAGQQEGLRRIQELPTVRLAALVEHRIDLQIGAPEAEQETEAPPL